MPLLVHIDKLPKPDKKYGTYWLNRSKEGMEDLGALAAIFESKKVVDQEVVSNHEYFLSMGEHGGIVFDTADKKKIRYFIKVEDALFEYNVRVRQAEKKTKEKK
jgi:hypothetical protein